jgi:hypothetical protein
MSDETTYLTVIAEKEEVKVGQVCFGIAYFLSCSETFPLTDDSFKTGRGNICPVRVSLQFFAEDAVRCSIDAACSSPSLQ